MTEFVEVLDEYLERNRMHHFEAESGVRNIRQIAEAIGYRQGIEEMLADNPGMQDAIIEWLRDQNVSDWTRGLEKDMGGYDEDDEDDE